MELTDIKKSQCCESVDTNALSDEGLGVISSSFRHILNVCYPHEHHCSLLKTPERAAKALVELVSGYHMDLNEVINGAIYPVSTNDWVMLKDIQFSSLCEHHMLPFFGTIDVGYLPNKQVIGLSKIPRIVEVFSRRLQLQERLGLEIANALYCSVSAQHVRVIIRAQHSCMMIRGINKQGASMVTQSVKGRSLTQEEHLCYRDLLI
ncbi:MAG: GTP cyclohydrolase I [Candidatus Comchoanobacterales bacterium]